MVMGDNKINDYKKCRQIDVDFDPHAAGVIQRNAHHLMEHILASYEATRCCHQVSAHALLPQRLQWFTVLNETQKHYQNTTFT